MSDQTPVLLTIWEIAVEAGAAGRPIDLDATLRTIAAKHPASGLSIEEISALLERAAAKRGVPVQRSVEQLVA